MDEPVFLRSDDFAAIVTPGRGAPNATATTDEFIVWALATRRILVDTEAGIICRRDGISRAEMPTEKGSGRVYLGLLWGKRWLAMAHRIVWIARHGPIPGNYRIAHRNGHRWDNRAVNLAMVTHSETMRHAHASGYIGEDVNGPDDRVEVHPYSTGSIIEPKTRRRVTAA